MASIGNEINKLCSMQLQALQIQSEFRKANTPKFKTAYMRLTKQFVDKTFMLSQLECTLDRIKNNDCLDRDEALERPEMVQYIRDKIRNFG